LLPHGRHGMGFNPGSNWACNGPSRHLTTVSHSSVGSVSMFLNRRIPKQNTSGLDCSSAVSKPMTDQTDQILIRLRPYSCNSRGFVPKLDCHHRLLNRTFSF